MNAGASKQRPNGGLFLLLATLEYNVSYISEGNTMATPEVPGYLKVSKILVYVMYAWVMIGIVLLSLRVFLLAFSANQTAGFVEFVYKTSADYLQPFRGIFPPKPITETGYLDVSALFAIIIYALIGWGFSALISYIQDKIDAYQASSRTDQKATVVTERASRTTRKVA